MCGWMRRRRRKRQENNANHFIEKKHKNQKNQNNQNTNNKRAIVLFKSIVNMVNYLKKNKKRSLYFKKNYKKWLERVDLEKEKS